MDSSGAVSRVRSKTPGSVGTQIIAVTARFVLNLHHDLKSHRCACLFDVHLNDVVAELHPLCCGWHLARESPSGGGCTAAARRSVPPE